MTISIQQGDLLETPCDLLVVNLFEGFGNFSGAVGALDKSLDGALADLIKRDGFAAKRGEHLLFPTLGKLKARKVAVIGLGKRQKFTADTARIIGGSIVKIARDAKAKKAVILLPAALDAFTVSQTVSEGLHLGAYRFHAYHGTGSKDRVPKTDIAEVVIVESEKSKIKAATVGLERGRVLAEATAFARDLVNTPPHDMTPQHMVDVAKSLVTRGSRIRCTVLDRAKMEALGMGGALAVAAGSQYPPFGVHLTYTPSRRAKKRIAVVGKAVTYDSGGLSLKPTRAMVTMKIDMAGAAAVLGLFKLLPVLDLPIEVHGVFLAVENMPSGTAFRPDDVVRIMNGMTVEIVNTDAEGRIALADALSYVVKKVKPDTIIDLATLSGATGAALGPEVSSILGNDRSVVKGMLTASQSTGENLCELPLYAPYEESLRSPIADFANVSGLGDAIKSALFLQHFTGEIPWAHLDIGEPAYCKKETRPDVPFGGTGVGVRTLAKWLELMK